MSEETLIVLATPKCDPNQAAVVFSNISSLSELEGKKKPPTHKMLDQLCSAARGHGRDGWFLRQNPFEFPNNMSSGASSGTDFSCGYSTIIQRIVP